MTNDLINRIDDLINLSRYKCVSTNFLNVEEVAYVKKYLENKKISYKIYGGYDGSDRNKFYFYSDESLLKYDISCLVSKYNSKFNDISHRDILGSIMALNISRDYVGDLFILEDKIVIYISDTLRDFIIQNLKSIKRCSTDFTYSEINYGNINNKEEIEIIISSNRLDNIVSSLSNISRNVASELISNGFVFVNHVEINKTSYKLKEDDVISIRGKGRFIFKKVVKITSKNKLIVSIIKFV